jgi:hypothetical protein
MTPLTQIAQFPLEVPLATAPFPCNSTPLTANDFSSVLATLGTDAAAVWAILEVESGKAGYLPDRRPQILFERAVFHTRTKGAYDQSHPGISAPTWGGYSGGAAEYTRMAEAYALSPDDALQSASWGIAQVMGFNFSSSGYSSAAAYVQDACASEGAQLLAFQSFLMHTGIGAALQAHDWTTVALKYNGPGQVATYAQRLQTNYNALQDPSKLPDLDVRAVQLYLSFLAASENNPAFNPGGIDGVLGTPGSSRTLAALNAFQTAQGLPTTTAVSDDVVAALAAALPPAQDLSIA